MHPASLAARCHDTGATQIGEVARDFRLADPEDFHEITDAYFSVGNQVQQAETRGIGQGAEQKIDGKRFGLFRHSWNHYIWLDRYEQGA